MRAPRNLNRLSRIIGIRRWGNAQLNVLQWIRAGHDWRIVAEVAVVCAITFAGGLYVYAATRRSPGRSFWLVLASLTQRWASTIGLLLLGVLGAHFMVHPSWAEAVPMATAGGLILLITAGVAVDGANRIDAIRRLEQILDGLPEGVSVFDPADRLVTWNTRYAEIFRGSGINLVKGVSYADLFKQGLAAGVTPKTADSSEANAWLAERLAVRRGERPNLVQQTSDGRWVRVSDRRSPDGGLVSTCVDVTDLKSAEAAATAARDRAERLAAIGDRAEALARIGHWRMDIATREMKSSPGYAQIFGLEPEGLLDIAAFLASLHPDDIDSAHEMAQRQIAGAETNEIAVWRIIRSSGEVRYVQCSMTAERGPDGQPVALLGTAVDVTDLTSAEAAATAARDRAERLATMADQAETLACIGHWWANLATGTYEWSPGFIRIYGLPPGAQMDVETIQGMIHPDDTQQGGEFLRRRIAGDLADEIAIMRIIQPSGAVRYLHCKMDVARDAEGQPVTAFGTVVDVTEAKLTEMALAESETRFRNLAVNAPDMIVESQPDRTLTYISPASEAITGYRPEELLNGVFARIVNPDDMAAVLHMCEDLVESKGATPAQPVEFRVTHRSGEVLWLESKPSYITDAATGRHIGFIDVVRDVTSRKRLEAELRAARAEAEAAAAVKTDFLANMTHELRTPLTSILGFTAMAQANALSPDVHHCVERISEAGRALLCTVNDILDFSKLEAGQVAIRPEPVRVEALARGALDLFAPQAAAKALELVFDADEADVVVSLDPDRMRQILLNLVGNAVKFTASGAVTLRLRYDRGGRTLAAEVIDTGAGVPPDKLEQLFKRFSQVDGSLTHVQGGTGLGLAICKGLVEAMGGEIGVESREGEGSRFWFRVPAPLASASDATTAAPAPADRAGLDGLRVLVVDDHPANRELARLYLTGAGAEVSEADDGEAAVALASDGAFDVILMDMRMPRLDGPGALQRIRASQGPNKATPIVAFTADLTGETAADLRGQGFCGGVAKPLEARALLEAVAQAGAFEESRPMDGAAAVTAGAKLG